MASGRTDAGVHAEGQVVNFDITESIDSQSILRALNSVLPWDIRIKNVVETDSLFHSRFCAKSREYRYLFSEVNVPLYLRNFVTHIGFVPETSVFDALSQIMIGEHDFSVFRSRGSSEKTTVRCVNRFEIEHIVMPNLYGRDEVFEYYCLIIEANSFLYRMVRNLMGSIFEVLKAKRSVSEFSDQVLRAEKKYLFTTAPPQGLSLVKVNY